jgi:hypothetical protein
MAACLPPYHVRVKMSETHTIVYYFHFLYTYQTGHGFHLWKYSHANLPAIAIFGFPFISSLYSIISFCMMVFGWNEGGVIQGLPTVFSVIGLGYPLPSSSRPSKKPDRHTSNIRHAWTSDALEASRGKGSGSCKRGRPLPTASYEERAFSHRRSRCRLHSEVEEALGESKPQRPGPCGA